MAKKRVLHEITLTKIAAVDVPCQEHALATIMKGKDSGDESDKAGLAGDTDNKGVNMSAINKALGLPETATEAQALEAIAKMNNASEADKKAKMKADEEVAKLKAEVETIEKARKAAETDENFQSFDGSIVKKSEVGNAFAVMKSMNDELIKTRTAAETNEFAKRAEVEFKHVPGSVDDKVSILRVAKSASEEGRKALETMLKGYNDMIEAGMNTIGKKMEKPAGDAESQLDDMAKRRAEKENISVEQAYAKVLETTEGAALYAKLEA